MAKQKRYIIRYGLEIPEQRGTPRIFKFLAILLLIGGIVTGFVLFVRWVSDDSIDYGEVTVIESPTATRAPRPTSSPTPTPIPTPRIFMSDVLGDAYGRYSNVAGLLYIQNTSISEIVFKSSDNEYYFTHNSSGQQDSGGEVFVDFEYPLHELKQSANIVIYGVVLPNDMKFGQLESYASSNFFKANKKVVLETLYAAYEFEIFAYYVPVAEQEEEEVQAGEAQQAEEEEQSEEIKEYLYNQTVFEDKFDFEDFVLACKAKSKHETEYTPYNTDTILTLVAVSPGGGEVEAVVQAYFKNKVID